MQEYIHAMYNRQYRVCNATKGILVFSTVQLRKLFVILPVV